MLLKVPESRGGCLKKLFLLNPTVNLFGNSALACPSPPTSPCPPLCPLPMGRCSSCTDNRLLRRGICKSCFSSSVPFFQAPGRSLIASPMGWHGTEKRETFEVEVSCTNGIITPGNHLQSNYGLLLACSSFFFFLLLKQ